MEDFKIMFLTKHLFENGQAIRGGFLTTDSTTKPLEFRCTDPIRPTGLQKTLYGGMLEQHIAIELIGKPLINSAKEKPKLIFVRQEIFLLLRPSIDIPMLCISKDTEISTTNTQTNEQSKYIATSESGKFEPVIISSHKDFSEEREKQRALINDIFKQYNLLEPFDRIATALELVHKQKVGETR